MSCSNSFQNHIFQLDSDEDGVFIAKSDLEQLLGDDIIIHCKNGHAPKMMNVIQSETKSKIEKLCENDEENHCDFKERDNILQEHTSGPITFKCDVCGGTYELPKHREWLVRKANK
jgi:hypothetical protein